MLVVWKLDRLDRSLSHLIRIVEDLKTRGVAFRSLTEAIDTTNSHGAFLFNLFGTLAEYERVLITERVNAGLAAARRRGRKGSEQDPRKIVRDLYQLLGTLAEILGVSRPTAWRIGHALRLMGARETMLAGTVEIDHFHRGGRPRKRPDEPPPGRGRKGQANTDTTPVLGMVQRPADAALGTPAGDARAAVVTGLSLRAAERAIEAQIDPDARLMSDEAKAFMAIGESFADHETVNHSSREYVRDAVHVNSVEGFNSRIRRTIAGVFHHISPQHVDLYFHEMGFRWSQRVVDGQAVRKTRSGRQAIKTIWSRVPPALQLMQVFRFATGRQMRRWRHHHQIGRRCIGSIKASYAKVERP
ncbi:hypothetical protein GCM10007920_33250 [Ciceribacter naphthalenivorans]|uniref:Resolvase/invertase-type recombinase catalytic domain-containing protein n=1 Tax=Sphingomonas psychrolutea TaxID=1259676 RepID=A0ABQ6EEW5_9SPHN|nr:hypothetical protein GCM10007920_33250 [Ciceribacter naphthalenivorans]GLT06390.1 hypothetical protein GCM10007926_33250 [Sphingomonas psychrolutea]